MRFVDAHTHLELFALKSVAIEGAESKKELLSLLENAEVDSLVAWGWNEDKLGETITKHDIDRFAFPILLIRIDGHLGVVNDRVIKRYNLTKSDKFDPDLGYVYEDILWSLTRRLKQPVTKDHLLRAQDEALSMGVVEVHDFVDLKTAREYFNLRGMGQLRLKVVLMPYYDHYEGLLSLFDRWGESENLRCGWVKIFVDGSIGARTAYLKQPYSDKKTNGILLKNEDELAAMITTLEKMGLRASLHAIGDGAIDVVLKSLERANISLKGHRIEHAEMITVDQAYRVKEMGLILCVQPNFNPVFMETYVRALGRKRARAMNPLRMLDETGVSMIFGSDMMPFDPDVGLNYAATILGSEKAYYYYGGWSDSLIVP